MIAFRIRLNGRKLATAGAAGSHVLTLLLNSIVRGDEARRNWPADVPFEARDLTLDVGAMLRGRGGAKEHVRWSRRGLKVGDRVSVTIVDVRSADPPIERQTSDELTIERAERRQLEHLKRKYGRAGRTGRRKA
jgi:hypothetical protein